jgi:drug/metabolite transporter (DMT)-like permease
MDEVRSGAEAPKSRSLKTIVLIAIMVVAGPLGNVLLGQGMKQIRPVLWPPIEFLRTGLQILSSHSIWLGIGSLLAFFIANLLVLSWADYSFVQPASSVAYAVVALLGYFMLGERVSPLRWLGIAVICVGVLVVGRTNPRTTEHT